MNESYTVLTVISNSIYSAIVPVSEVVKVFFRFGVDDMDQSSRRICNAASGAPEDHLIIFLAHNGPTGTFVLHFWSLNFYN